jgi:hypothetical protein
MVNRAGAVVAGTADPCVAAVEVRAAAATMTFARRQRRSDFKNLEFEI